MLGLMEKDLRLTLARKQTMFIFLALALVMGLSMEGTFLIGYLTMLATVVAIGTISYDEFDNGFAFLMTLPFDRKTYVREKYLFCLLMAAAAWCLGAILYGAGNSAVNMRDSLIDELPMLLAMIPVVYLSAAIMIPMQLKFGSEKGRIVMFLIFGLAAVLVAGGKQLLGDSPQSLAGLAETLEGLLPAVVLLALTAVCVLLAYASCLWSIRIMEKKEF